MTDLVFPACAMHLRGMFLAILGWRYRHAVSKTDPENIRQVVNSRTRHAPDTIVLGLNEPAQGEI